MRTLAFAAAVFAVLAAGDSERAPGQAALADTLALALTPEDVARRVDEHFYYPQEHGLETMRARVRVPELDSLFAANATPMPEITFVWRAPDARSFSVGASKAQQLRGRVIRLLDGRGEMIVPRPLAMTLARYETREVETHGDTLVLTASTADTTFDLRSLRLTIEPHAWRLLRMEASTTRGPLLEDNEFRQADDLNVLSAMHVRFADIEARVRLDYTQAEGLWLVSRIAYSVRGGSVGRNPNDFEILLDSYRVNAAARDR